MSKAKDQFECLLNQGRIIEIKLLIKRTCIFCSILGAKFTVLFFSKLSFEKNLISFYALDGIDSAGQ